MDFEPIQRLRQHSNLTQVHGLSSRLQAVQEKDTAEDAAAAAAESADPFSTSSSAASSTPSAVSHGPEPAPKVSATVCQGKFVEFGTNQDAWQVKTMG